jgi:aminoglycoside phosphotransferase (APT) family kinase protein
MDVVQTSVDAGRLDRPPLIVLDPLADFLDAAGIGSGSVAVRAIGAGHSNVTFEVRRGELRMILRRPPRPPIAASAHDVLREAELQRRLHRAGAAVPAVLAVCDSPEVIGSSFYVMEFVEGEVLGPPDPALDKSQRGRVGEEMIDALVAVHALDVANSPLASIGRPAGYLDRQIARFSAIWAAQRTRDVPELEATARWLAEHRPESRHTTVVHGDYRLGNVLFSTASMHVAAILDWEMATLGDPLADLGYLSASWAEPDDPDNPIRRLSAITRSSGFPSRAELHDRYGAATGRSLEALRWYEVLAFWKSAIFLESSYRRYLHGSTDDTYFASLEAGVPELAREALERASDG